MGTVRACIGAGAQAPQPPGSSRSSSLGWPCLAGKDLPPRHQRRGFRSCTGAQGNPAFTGKDAPPTLLVWRCAPQCPPPGQDCPIHTVALLLADDEVLTTHPCHPRWTPESAGRAPGLAGVGQHAGRGGAQTWGSGGGRGGTQIAVCQSRAPSAWEGKSPAHSAPPSPQLCLQALGQLCLVADGAGTTMQAVVVTGQAAGCYLAIWAAAGQKGSGMHVPPACPVLPHPGPGTLLARGC